MPGREPERVCEESLNMGITIFAPISSVAGSSTIIFSQTLLTGRVFAASAVSIGAQTILFIAQRFFKVKSIPILDVTNEQTVQMPISELQDFLKWMASGSRSSPNVNTTTNGTLTNSNGALGVGTGERGFPTPESPEAPLVFAIFFNADYSNELYTPYIRLTIPLFIFPGLRGALPLLIVGLLATIFVRAVVPPETTGSRPLRKPVKETNNNTPLTFTPSDLLQLLTRFGTHFGTK